MPESGELFAGTRHELTPEERELENRIAELRLKVWYGRPGTRLKEQAVAELQKLLAQRRRFR